MRDLQIEKSGGWVIHSCGETARSDWRTKQRGAVGISSGISIPPPPRQGGHTMLRKVWRFLDRALWALRSAARWLTSRIRRRERTS